MTSAQPVPLTDEELTKLRRTLEVVGILDYPNAWASRLLVTAELAVKGGEA